MKIKRIRIVLTAALLTLSAYPMYATVTYTPSQPNVEQQVTFQVTNPSGIIIAGSVQWEFGDSTTASGPTTVTKAYTAARTYLVEVTYNTAARAPVWKTETVAITIDERRRISFAPNNPLVNQTVTLIAENFLSSSIRWDFGDGTPLALLSSMVTHAFTWPATFMVRARDLGGASVANITASLTIRIDAARRRITYSPVYPVVGRPVAFNAENFYTNRIKWDFGDGTPPVTSSINETHIYLKSGTFTVRAWDWEGRYGEAQTQAITVKEEKGPRAAFQISFIQLRFEDGKSYQVVAKDFRPLVAYADIKYEGTGLFQAQWLLDGQPFGNTTKAMPFSNFINIDSGKLPALPTQMLGMHEVSLKILQPQADFKIPAIRYFVSAGTGPELKRVDINILAAEGLEGMECSLEQDVLQAPSGSYAIFRGNIQSRNITPVPWALFRIHVGSELVDQQLVKNLRPGEKREFVTSIFNPSPDPKMLYITFYDITKEPPSLLFFRKLILQQKS
jgi:PKD repeat protein